MEFPITVTCFNLELFKIFTVFVWLLIVHMFNLSSVHSKPNKISIVYVTGPS